MGGVGSWVACARLIAAHACKRARVAGQLQLGGVRLLGWGRHRSGLHTHPLILRQDVSLRFLPALADDAHTYIGEPTLSVLEIDVVLFVEPTVEIGWDRIFLLF